MAASDNMNVEPFDSNYIQELVSWVRPLWSMVDWKRSVSAVDGEKSLSTVDLDVEFIVRHNIFHNEFALQLVEGERVLAVAFAARKNEENEALQWLAERVQVLTEEEVAGMRQVVDYLEDMDRRTCRHMGDGDIRLTLFASGSPGGGGLILAELEERLRRCGFTSLYLWTDSDCNHQWYPRHGFTLVEEAPNETFSTPQRQFMTYIFRKVLTP